MSEYRALRERYSLLDLCRTPDLATEVTLQPVRRIDVDAAILFSDLLLPLEPMGIRFDFIQGEGPAIENPLRSEADLARVRRFEPREALSLRARRDPADQGRARRPRAAHRVRRRAVHAGVVRDRRRPFDNFAHTKALMYGVPAAWHRFCDTLADVVGDYLVAQIEAGVDAVQVFDSWVGALNAADYREFILPHTRRIFERRARRSACRRFISASAPASILGELREAGGDVIGADWRTPLDDAWERIGCDRGIQGNLDPTLLLGPLDRVFAAADDVLERAGGRPGHIFNLGHGILPIDARRARPGARAIRASKDRRSA